MEFIDPNDIVSNWVREEAKKHEKRTPDVIYVTDLTQCPYKRLFSLKYPEIVEGEMFSQYATHGVVVHEGLEAIFKQEYESLGYRVYPEYEVSKEINGYIIKGRIDLLIEDPDGNKIVIDIKNPKARGPSWPSEHHIMQVAIYMNMVEADEGVLYYFTHDGRASYYINEPFPDEEIARLVDETINPSADNSPRFDWECRGYCSFSQLCPYAKLRWNK